MRLMAGACVGGRVWANEGIATPGIAKAPAKSARTRLRSVGMIHLVAVKLCEYSTRYDEEGHAVAGRGRRRRLRHWPLLTRTRLQAALILDRLPPLSFRTTG